MTSPFRFPVVLLAVLVLLSLPNTGCTPLPEEEPAALEPVPPAMSSGDAVSADGTRIRWERHGQGGRPLVLVHGWSADMTYWAAQVGALSDAQEVVLLDLAGHGESDSSREDYTIDLFAEDVAAVVRELDLRDAVLVGHSMGTYVCLEAAPRLAGRVIAVVSVDQLHDVGDPIEPQARDALLGALQMNFAAGTERFVKEFLIDPETVPELADAIAADMAAAPPAVGLSALRHTLEYDVAAGLRGVAVPVRCINGDHTESRPQAARAVHQDFQVRVVEDAGHYPMMEQPEAFNTALQEVLIDLP